MILEQVTPWTTFAHEHKSQQWMSIRHFINMFPPLDKDHGGNKQGQTDSDRYNKIFYPDTQQILNLNYSKQGDK